MYLWILTLHAGAVASNQFAIMRLSRLIHYCLVITFLFSSFHIYSQTLPKDYFCNPLDCDIGLSATFGEFRTGHFHAGIDMRTGGVTGLPVHAAADGYVARIIVSPWGGGKILYIKHPNGYTTVYMHLENYAGKIGQAVLEEQYAKQSFSISKNFSENEIPVRKGQVVAYSGNSGSSGGPHLHFEIRRADSPDFFAKAHTINPLLAGLPYTDNLPPVIRGIRLYPSQGNPIVVDRGSVDIAGPFHLGVYATDAAEGSTERNGVDRMEIYVDGSLFFKYTTSSFPLDSSRISNALIDYPLFLQTRQAYLLTRSLPGAQGDWIPVRQHDGILRFIPGTSHTITVKVFDIKDNLAEQTFNVNILPTPDATAAGTAQYNTYAVRYDKPLKITGKEMKLIFPVYMLYDNDRVKCYPATDSRYPSPLCTVRPCTSPLPPLKAYTLSIKANRPLEKAVIVRVDGNRMSAYPTSREGDWYTASVRDFGQFALAVDNEAPRISPINFKDGKKLKTNTLRIKISDNLSGIDTYNCHLNGEWILAEYDGKSATLTIDAGEKIIGGANKLRVTVIDAAGNVADVTYIIRKT